MAVAVGLVLLGGAFAGLTIALMGQVRSYFLPEKLPANSLRMKYTYRSSGHLEMGRKRSMLREFCDCLREGNTGSW